VGAGPAGWIAAALLLAGLANGIVNPSLDAFLTLIVPPAVRSQALTAVLARLRAGVPARPGRAVRDHGRPRLATLRRRESLPATAS